MAQIMNGTIVVSCSWCHESNEAEMGGVLCSNCGHRADVARVDCDCGKCSRESADPVFDQLDRPRR